MKMSLELLMTFRNMKTMKNFFHVNFLLSAIALGKKMRKYEEAIKWI